MKHRMGVCLFICFMISVSLPESGLGSRLIFLLTCSQVAEPDIVPKGGADRFAEDTPAIHAVAVFAQARSGTVLTGTWIAVDAVPTPNYTIDSSQVRLDHNGETKARFSLSKPTKGWPVGTYRFELSVGKSLISAADFTIVAQSKNQPAQQQSQNQQRRRPSQRQSNDSVNSPDPGTGASAALIGCWQCQTAEGFAALIFHSADILSQDGVQYRYSLLPGAIRISDGYQFADYYYETDGQQLAAVYPDGSQIFCIRSDCSSLVTSGGRHQEGGSSSGGYAAGGDGGVVATPGYDSGSWETESDRQYYDDSAGYGGGAYENPSSDYYDYGND